MSNEIISGGLVSGDLVSYIEFDKEYHAIVIEKIVTANDAQLIYELLGSEGLTQMCLCEICVESVKIVKYGTR